MKKLLQNCKMMNSSDSSNLLHLPYKYEEKSTKKYMVELTQVQKRNPSPKEVCKSVRLPADLDEYIHVNHINFNQLAIALIREWIKEKQRLQVKTKKDEAQSAPPDHETALLDQRSFCDE